VPDSQTRVMVPSLIPSLELLKSANSC